MGTSVKSGLFFISALQESKLALDFLNTARKINKKHLRGVLNSY